MRRCAMGHPDCFHIGDSPHSPPPAPAPLTEERVREIVREELAQAQRQRNIDEPYARHTGALMRWAGCVRP